MPFFRRSFLVYITFFFFFFLGKEKKMAKLPHKKTVRNVHCGWWNGRKEGRKQERKWGNWKVNKGGEKREKPPFPDTRNGMFHKSGAERPKYTNTVQAD